MSIRDTHVPRYRAVPGVSLTAFGTSASDLFNALIDRVDRKGDTSFDSIDFLRLLDPIVQTVVAPMMKRFQRRKYGDRVCQLRAQQVSI